MGLDMYLTKKHYIGNKYRRSAHLVKVIVPEDQKDVVFPTAKIKDERISEITEEVAYWRKANHIHKWFVDNIQEGNDDCGEYYVSQNDIKKLLEVVNKVLDASKLIKGKIQNGSRSYTNDKGEYIKNEPIMEDGEYIEDPTIAKKLLPVQEGFFFGSTAYDQYYYEDLVYTKKTLEDLLQEDSKSGFEYSSSW